MDSNKQHLDYRSIAFPTELHLLICRVGLKLLFIVYSVLYSHNVTRHCVTMRYLHQACIKLFLLKQKISPRILIILTSASTRRYAFLYKCIRLLCMHDIVTCIIVAIYLHSIRCFPSLRNEKRHCCYNIITTISHVISSERIHGTEKYVWSGLLLLLKIPEIHIDSHFKVSEWT